MKKIYYLIILIAGLIPGVTSCDLFKIDNFPQPDAQVYGAIRDSVGGGLVETDIQNGSTIGAYQLGKYADNPILSTWVVKQNGEYRNNLVYSDTYKIDFVSCNFFPHTLPEVVFKSGANEHDFLVVPYIRIKNLTITHDVAGNKINASFTLEAGKPTVKVASITLYAYTDMYVGAYVKKTLNTGTGTPTRTLNATINPATVYTLSIDLAANTDVSLGFGVHRNYYFRVGAMASQTGVGTIRSNYAPYVVIAL
jgi:hypothetical protein